jgi:hypothetical protein
MTRRSSPAPPRAAIAGGVFGFAMAATFVITGYDGADPLTHRLPASALLGLVGSACALLLALLGAAGRGWTTRISTSD